MFKTIEKSYAHYVSECEKYKEYKKRWKWIWPKHHRWEEVTKNKTEWCIKLHAMEDVLNLSRHEKML